MNDTRRAVSPGAERWLGLRIAVLDHGFIALVDYAGTDASVAQAARVSTGSASKGPKDDRRLIRYLWRHGHHSPFEHVETVFHMRLPIFVARQIVRHRTASINEHSARYSTLTDEFYVPQAFRAQTGPDRQTGDAPLPDAVADQAAATVAQAARLTYQAYTDLLALGVARELARVILPVGVYTEWYWKIDLRNLLHFIRLRIDRHAQAEVRVYAEAMAQIVREGWPFVWEAFEDYTLESMSLSRAEVAALRAAGVRARLADVQTACAAGLATERERCEFLAKLQRLGILDE